jgi:ligand-binding sensor domain-containing protein
MTPNITEIQKGQGQKTTTIFGELTIFDTSNSELPENFIYDIAFDKNDNIWVGSWSNGIAVFDGNVWKNFNTSNSNIPNDTIYTIVADSKNHIWCGTRNGLAKFDGSSWAVYKPENSPMQVPFVRNIGIDKENTIWFSCGNVLEGGLMTFDGKNWELYTPENSILPCRAIDKILIDENNVKWVGTTQYQGTGGLVRIKGKTWDLYNKSNSIMPYNSVESLASDGFGNIWIGHRASFFLTDSLEGALIKVNENGLVWSKHNPSNSGESSNRVRELAGDRNGYIWVATGVDHSFDYNISVYNGNKWLVLSSIDTINFKRLCIFDIEVDHNNNIWFATGKGLYLLKPKSLDSIFNDSNMRVFD